MSLFSKKTVIALTCSTALVGLTAAPSLAGVITPADKTAVSTGSPIDSVYYRYGWCHHRHHAHWWRPTVWVYPAYYPYAGWGGWGWGGGGLLGGLFPFI